MFVIYILGILNVNVDREFRYYLDFFDWKFCLDFFCFEGGFLLFFDGGIFLFFEGGFLLFFDGGGSLRFLDGGGFFFVLIFVLMVVFDNL